MSVLKELASHSGRYSIAGPVLTAFCSLVALPATGVEVGPVSMGGFVVLALASIAAEASVLVAGSLSPRKRMSEVHPTPGPRAESLVEGPCRVPPWASGEGGA